MFQQRWFWIGISICLGMPWAWAQPYRIQGIVEDENRQPLDQIPVFLVYDNGLRFETITKFDGTFDFDHLPDGYATCFLQLPPGYQPLSPPCASYRVNVSEELYLTFGARGTTTGVVVTFGSPRGNGPRILWGHEEADADLILDGLGDYAPTNPDAIVITGTWSLPTSLGFPIPTIAAEIHHQYGSGNDYNITAIPLPNGRVQYEIQCVSPQAVLKNGRIASLQLGTRDMNAEEFPAVDAPVFFCMESVLVYANDKVIDTKLNLGWHGILEID